MNNSFGKIKKFPALCVGLDPEMDLIPKEFQKDKYPLYQFCKSIVEIVAHDTHVLKPNIAFFEHYGSKGIFEFEMLIKFIKKNYPEMFIIADVKRGDLENTSKHYAEYYFKFLDVDSVTLSPYMGLDSIKPFLKFEEKFIFILCLTSNPSSNDFQKQTLKNTNLFLYEEVIANFNSPNIGFVVGGTHEEELVSLRIKYPEQFFLIPGIGKQGGDLEKTLNICGTNSIINLSRTILYPDVKS